ncbi:hypothetical protein WA026_008316 [Henosepilachna vigintioctopunctata]|uniref:HTH psq-type domain-containing protein n=1 Tax=Henosepilachna vigintioctopunctata TaxID=420089 RepID=A0AAW1UA63_9CUCU
MPKTKSVFETVEKTSNIQVKEHTIFKHQNAQNEIDIENCRRNLNQSVPRSKTGIKRRKLCPDTLTAAVEEAKGGNSSIRKVAKKYELPKSTIFKYLKLNESNDLRNSIQLLKNDVRRVFDPEEEILLCKYLKKAALLHMGLNTKQCRELAYQYAVSKQKTNVPANWETHKMAGIGWLRNFRLRFPVIISTQTRTNKHSESN